jgi:enoyl-CoA hydratase/carnithine racemase
MDIGGLRRHLKLGPRLARAWQEMDQITIAAIEGFCIGGGIALAVALDFRVMSRAAHIRIPEIGLGMNMSWQSIPRLLHLMGPARTKQAVILADQRITAEEARPMPGVWWRRSPIPARRSMMPWRWPRSSPASRRSRLR